MANQPTQLDIYLEKSKVIEGAINEGRLPLEDMLKVQELTYRISVIRTLRHLAKTAPVTLEKNSLTYHYVLYDSYIKMLMDERKFGSKVDETGKQSRATAWQSLSNVVESNRKVFTSFNPTSDEYYRNEIRKQIESFLYVWITYRNTYVKI